jgi:hypothetical protein
MKPWSEEMFDGGDHYDEIDAMYKECKADEFYFGFSHCYGGVVICISPASYFDENGYGFDQEMQIRHLLPKHLNGLDETNYSFKGTPREVQAEMLALGFRQNDKFGAYCIEESGDEEELEGKNILDLKPLNEDDEDEE